MPKGGRRVRIFSALEVANICGVVNQTTINWIRSGHLKAFKTPGGQYRIYAKDLAAFLDNRGMEASGEVLQVIMESANWDIFLIGAGYVQNNSIKTGIETSLPSHTIIQAYDWFDIGRRITEEKPGFILIDERLQGVDIPNFIKTMRDDPAFGKPIIFLISSGKSKENEIAGIYSPDMIFTLPLDLTEFKSVMKNMEKTHGFEEIA